MVKKEKKSPRGDKRRKDAPALIAELFRCGIISPKGKFVREGKRVKHDHYGMGSYVLAFEEEDVAGPVMDRLKFQQKTGRTIVSREALEAVADRAVWLGAA